jgi:hemoglobin/transferrin/lactoferrin receptor protein
MFESAFPDADITDLSMDAWLPKLGLLWPLNTPIIRGDMEWFAQYARGFRAPPFSDVNIGFAMPMFNTLAIPNPNLKAEEGRTVETGLRWRHQDTRVELTAFRNHYKNFIETRAALGFDPERGALVFQSLNRDRVRIEGAEMRLRQQLHTGWHLSFSAEWTRSFQHVAAESGRRHLAEVSPAKGILEMGWQPNIRGRWLEDYESRLYIIASKGQKDLYAADGSAQFSTPGYATVDWINRWSLRDHWQLDLGLFNLTDRQYWRHTAVVGRATGDPLLPLRAEPGRSVSLGIAKRW